MHKSEEKIKVIISCGSASWGGLEMVAVESALKFSKLGHI
jgi:hypothetical protein